MSTPIPMWWPVSNNFGDVIGPYICQKLTGRRVMFTEPNADYQYYVFGGSVLNHVNANAVVWGAGLGSLPDGVNPHCTIKAVRGPLTRARVLGVGRECPAVYGDPGMLLPKFYSPKPLPKKKSGIVPHYVDQYRAFDRYRDFIDVFQPIEAVIDEICSYERIYSSSLHGIIIAHAYGIPAAWIKLSDSLGGDGTKFRDYFSSIGMDVPQPMDLRERQPLPDFAQVVPQIDCAAYLKAFPL